MTGKSHLSRGHSPERLKRLLFGLFYPAVLGTFFVSLLPAIATSLRNGLSLSASVDSKLVICLLIVAHFVVDYIFTEEVERYQVSVFLLDLAVVVLLYIAYSSVYLGKPRMLEVSTTSLAMSGVYICFLLWEFMMRREIGKNLGMTIYEALSAIWFLVVGIWLPYVTFLALGLLIATLAMIIICGNVLHVYHSRLRRNVARMGS